MRIVNSINEYGQVTKPIVLTIGNFDGIHHGHQHVLSQVVEKAAKVGGESVVISFVNHPSEILRPDSPVSLLSTPQHKIQLLQKSGVDTLIFLTFTEEFSRQDVGTFFRKLTQALPFTNLVLGYDSRMGTNRKGDHDTILGLSKSLGFHAETIGRQTFDNIPVSSSRIRKSVQKGDLLEASRLLGRSYSIYGTVVSGACQGRKIGYPTANIPVKGLCLPPYGVYAINLKIEGKRYQGVANLGTAPTLRSDADPILESYLFEPIEVLYGKEVEVIPLEYLRPEKKFLHVEDLRTQIAIDIENATLFFKSLPSNNRSKASLLAKS